MSQQSLTNLAILANDSRYIPVEHSELTTTELLISFKVQAQKKILKTSSVASKLLDLLACGINLVLVVS